MPPGSPVSPGPARRLIVGLGNPGRRYQGSRHNVGFMVVEELARRHQSSFRSARGVRTAVVTVPVARLSLAKPVTYMNRSGDGLAPWFLKQGLPLADMLVVHDDLDLPVGRLRFRRSATAGGHRGVQSLIDRLGGGGFPRLKIGIGRPPEGVDPVDYVLARPDPCHLTLLAAAVEQACEACLVWAGEGIERAMNLYNTAMRPESGSEVEEEEPA